MLHGHGDNGYIYGQQPAADFSTNVWYGGEPAGLKEHLFGVWDRIRSYPEVLAESLARKAGRHHGLDPENILICNGATEAIYLLAQLFRRKRTGIVIPSFSEYEDACRIHDHSIQFIPWSALASGASLTGDLLWIGNPNNPTGAVMPALEKIIRGHPQIIFIVDEAFIEFAPPVPSLIPALEQLPNLVILRSLTKVFAIPGLRLGYITAGRPIIEKLKGLKMPWSVNVFALEAGHFIFDHYKEIGLPFEQLLADKADLVERLGELSIQVVPGQTHFFLCEADKGPASALQRWLLDRCRILIRDAGNFRGLGPDHFRLATQSPDRNLLLINALKEWQQLHY